MFFLNYVLILCVLIVLSSFFVLYSVNPVQSILFLILSFIFSSLLFLIMGAEFLAILILVVYVGAISILFLFVVMMLNLRLLELYFDFFRYLPVGAFISFFFLILLFLALLGDFGFFFRNLLFYDDFFYIWSNFLYYKNNIFNLGVILYNFYILFILLASLILLASMLGVIVLTVDFEYRIFLKKNFFLRSYKRIISNYNFWNI